MKINELVIGDWVYRTDFNTPVPSKIIGIEVVNYDKMEYVVDVFNKNGYNVQLYLNEIEPIPLTPEILEKNGFIQCEPQGYDLYVKDKEGEGLYRIFWQGESLNYYLEIDTYAYPFGEFGNVNIKYVHQLQHALRLCKIDKTITL